MANTLDLVSDALKKYVVAPLNAFGIGGFVFDIEADTIASLSSDITDHYTENNVAVQDHIAIRPKRITLKGYVGEVVYRLSDQSPGFLQKVTQKLTTVNAYLPQLSSAAQQIQGAIKSNSVSGVSLGNLSNIYSLVKNSFSSGGEQTNQKKAYSFFQALQSQGILMGVQTPWEFMPNMAIENVTAIQNEDTRFVTDFIVTLKEMRFASTETVAFTLGNTVKQGAAAIQGAVETSLGQVQGLNLPTSLLSGAQGLLTDAADFATGALKSVWGE